MDAGRDDCGGQGGCTLHHATRACRHLPQSFRRQENNRGAGDEILPFVRRAILRRTRPVGYACAVETDRRGANSLEGIVTESTPVNWRNIAITLIDRGSECNRLLTTINGRRDSARN